MAISVFIFPPVPRATVSATPPAPKPMVGEVADGRIIYYLRERLGVPCHVMGMMNALTKLDRPRNRQERRRSFGWHLEWLPVLLREGVVQRCGRKHVIMLAPGQAIPKPPISMGSRRGKTERRKQLTVEAQIPVLAVRDWDTQPVIVPPSEAPKTKSAPAPPSLVTDALSSPPSQGQNSIVAARLKQMIASIRAGSRLARHRWSVRTKKAWAGHLDGRRCWRGQRVVMADGIGGELLLVRRGLALVFADSRASIVDSRFRKVKARHVTLSKLPEAVLLGSRKLGKRERTSQLKAESCRRNGNCRVRAGRRPRGRPCNPKKAQYHLSLTLAALQAKTPAASLTGGP